jgi:hypothetical protein
MVTLMVRPSLAQELRCILEADRRPQAPRPVAPCEPLWLFCPTRGIGGQAELRDGSRTGVRTALDRRYGWRLARALHDAGATASLVEVARLPDHRQRQARVRWAAASATDEIQFGLRLTEPLREWRL